MKLAYTYDDHHNAGSEWKQRNGDLKAWLTDIFEAPAVPVAPGCTAIIRSHVSDALQKEGWALNVPLENVRRLQVFAVRGDLAIQLQTGNMSRAAYDLLKLQHLFQQRRIEAASLALPTKKAAKTIGDNIANAERIIAELNIFDRIITVPILIVAFE